MIKRRINQVEAIEEVVLTTKTATTFSVSWSVTGEQTTKETKQNGDGLPLALCRDYLNTSSLLRRVTTHCYHSFGISKEVKKNILSQEPCLKRNLSNVPTNPV